MRPDLIAFALVLLASAFVFAWLGVLVKRWVCEGTTRFVSALLNGMGFETE